LTSAVLLDRTEARFVKHLLRYVGLPYLFGGRGYAGIDCSSLIVGAIRSTVGKTVSQMPWMTADQLARGQSRITMSAVDPSSTARCALAFFDWDEDGIFEHAAVRLTDSTWMWSSTSAGQVVRVDPSDVHTHRRQWLEIEGALSGGKRTVRVVDWEVAEQ